MRYFLVLGLCLPACASTLDHQSELLLHPDSTVQAPALLGAAPGLIVGAPIWASVSLLAGSASDAAGYALPVFACPGALLLAGLPWLVPGP